MTQMTAIAGLWLVAGVCVLTAAQEPATRPAPREPARQSGTPDTRAALAELAEVRKDIVFKTVGEHGIPLDVFLPRQRKLERAPVVVFIHGGGWSAGSKEAIYADRFVGAVRQLLQAGVAIVSIDYRLAGQAESFADIVADCKDGVRWVRKHADELGLDAAKLGVWGPSAGGHLSLMTGLTDDRAFPGDPALADASAAVLFIVSWYGPADMTAQRRSGGGGSAIARLVGPQTVDAEAALRQASPVTYLGKTSVPTQLAHGDRDTTVPISQSELLVERARQTGATVEFIHVRNAGHNFMPVRDAAMEPSLEEIQTRTATFILTQFKLLPEPAKEAK